MKRNAAGTVTISSVQEVRSCESTACTKIRGPYGPVAEGSLVC
jgi:hypothetical protein